MNEKILSHVYELITDASEFYAQNKDDDKRSVEFVFAATQPAETVKGFNIPYGDGVSDQHGAGKLWGRGNGALIVVSVVVA